MKIYVLKLKRKQNEMGISGYYKLLVHPVGSVCDCDRTSFPKNVLLSSLYQKEPYCLLQNKRTVPNNPTGTRISLETINILSIQARKRGQGEQFQSFQAPFSYEKKDEMVFCYQNCSDLLWEKIVREKLLKFEAESREFLKNLRSLEQFIQTVKVQNNLW